MAAIVGYAGAVKVGANAVASVKQWELPLLADKYDVTSLGVAAPGWKSYLAGLTGAEAKVDVFLDPTDTNGQIALQNAILNGTSVTLNLYTTASHFFGGTAFVVGMDIKAPVNGPIEAALTAVFSGAISYT